MVVWISTIPETNRLDTGFMQDFMFLFRSLSPSDKEFR